MAVLLFVVVMTTHLPTFFRSVMDWDESLYFLMAEQWRSGHLPYTAIWDNKPIGIYGLFALFQSGFGDSVVSIRVGSVLFTSATAFAVFKLLLAADIGVSRPIALFAAFCYVVCSLTNDGLSANTEIFMVCFTAYAMLAALRGRRFLAGLLFGLAFMTKYVAAFEFPAIVFAAITLAPPGPRGRLVLFPILAPLVAGAALPLLATIALFATTGHFQPWLEDSILANFRRVSVPVPTQAIGYVVNIELWRWAPLFLVSLSLLVAALVRLPGILRRRAWSREERFHLCLALWLIGGCAGVASAKSFYDHYFLQLLPVMCLVLAWAVRHTLVHVYPRSRFTSGSLETIPIRHAQDTVTRPVAQILGLLAVLTLALPFNAAAIAIAQAAQPVLSVSAGRLNVAQDTPAQIARDLRQVVLPGGSQIYVFDYQPIIYSLARQIPPTKYVFPSVLTKCQLEHVAKVRATREVARILGARPEFIVRSRYPSHQPGAVDLRVYAVLEQTIAARYQLWRLYDEAAVYRLRASETPVEDHKASLPLPCPGD